MKAPQIIKICSICILLGAFIVWIYTKSDLRQLHIADGNYSAVVHKDWSERELRAKSVQPNLGSGDYGFLYLTDIRKVSIPIKEAIEYYEAEVERLNLHECHVDTLAEARRKFEYGFKAMSVDLPESGSYIVITQAHPVPPN